MILSISCSKAIIESDGEKRVDVKCENVQDSDEQMWHIVDFLYEQYGDKFLTYANGIYSKD